MQSSILLFASLAALASAAANWNGAPAVDSVVNGWKYVGCATEVQGRVLNSGSYSDKNVTIEKCQSFCAGKQLPLAGVEYGEQCFCGTDLMAPSTMAPQSDCNMKCVGNDQQVCGGPNRLSVFNSTTYKAPTQADTVGSWKYQSCYMEPQGSRALPERILATDDMTIPKCLNACKTAGYVFAGLEFGRECWCGQTKANNLVDAKTPGCAMQCTLKCSGDNSAICGGSNAIDIYYNGASKRDVDNDAEEAQPDSLARRVVGAAGSLERKGEDVVDNLKPQLARFVKLRRHGAAARRIAVVE